MTSGGSLSELHSIRISRSKLFAKEIDLLVSRAGGPGRYDRQYERGGQDLPIGFVRWSEGRNVAEFIEMVAAGQLNVKDLITHRYPFKQADQAYRLLDSPRRYETMGIVFTFADGE